MPDNLLIENQPECLNCPDDWLCCKTVITGGCLHLDEDTHRCTRVPRSLTCLKTACKHFETYRDGTIQTLTQELETRLKDEKNVCKGCGERPELVRLNNTTVEYWCCECYGSDCYATESKMA